MDYSIWGIDFYQTKQGEIFALVTLDFDENGKHKYENKFIVGIEKWGWSAENLLEEIQSGFSGHSVIDLIYHPEAVLNYFNLIIEAGITDIYDIIEDSEIPCIAYFDGNTYASLHFKKMNEYAQKLFEEIWYILKGNDYEVDVDNE